MDVTVPVYRQLCFAPDLCQGDATSLVFKQKARARALTRTHTALWLDPITECPWGELRDKSVSVEATLHLPPLEGKSPRGLQVCER